MRLPGRLRTAAGPAAVSALLALGYLVFEPASADLAAQTYRTELFERVGFGVWNGQWFAGHHTPGYSVLFPPLAALLGERVVAALAAVASAALFAWLAEGHWGERSRLGALWFGAGTAVNLYTGRLTFALGVALGLGALLALQRDRAWIAAGLAVVTALASPIAAFFLALAAVAVGGFATAAAAVVPVAALAIAFPEGGVEPFVTSAWWPVLAFAAAVLVLVPREERALRLGVALYAVAATAAYLLETPMGGNAARLGALFGGPLLACALWRRRTIALAVCALPLAYWMAYAPVRDVRDADGDPSVHAAYHRPLLDFLERARPRGRVEVAVTRNHWEVVHVSPRFPLARGWERQLDVKYGGLFYRPGDPGRADEGLGAGEYRRWLDELGVDYVAIPDVRLDYAAEPEARLVERGLPYLRPAWRSRHWRVWRVLRPAPPATGPVRVTDLGPEAFTLVAGAPGRADVKVRWTRWWRVEEGEADLEEGPGGFTRVRVARPGRIRVAAP